MLFIVLIILFPFAHIAQASEVEKSEQLILSLEDGLLNEDSDSARVSILLEISKLIGQGDKDKSIKYASQAFELSKKSKDESLIYKSVSNLGDLQCDIYQYERALKSWSTALISSMKMNDFEKRINSYTKLGDISRVKGDFSNAVNYYILGLKTAKASKIDSSIALINFKLGRVHFVSENYDAAMESFNNALTIYLSLENYYMIARLRFEMANLYLQTGDIKKAKENYILSNHLSKYFKDKAETAYLYERLGSLYYMQDSLLVSLDYFTAALGISISLSNPRLNAVINNGIGTLSLKMEEYNEAKKYFLKALSYSLKSADKNIELNIYDNLSSCYKLLTDYKKALLYKEKYIQLRSSMFSTEKAKIIENSLARHKTEEKEIENELLRKDKKILSLENSEQKYIGNFIIVVASIVLIIAIFLFRNNKIKQKINNELSQKNSQIEKQRSMLEKLNDELVGRNEEIELINLNLMESESQLIEANCSKDKFFSLMAHDIKNPISGFILSTDLLANYYNKLEKDEILIKIKKINFTAIKLRDLLDNILTWARTQSGTIEFNPEKVEIKCLAKDVCDLLKENARHKNITLKNEILNEEFALVDKYMIETVIRNLVSNAIKFTSEGGLVRLFSEHSGDLIIISCQDNGVGIPSNKIGDLFSITSQYTTRGTFNESGTGLGLIMCKDFVEKNAGHLSLVSKVGEGTKFSFSLKRINA